MEKSWAWHWLGARHYLIILLGSVEDKPHKLMMLRAKEDKTTWLGGLTTSSVPIKLLSIKLILQNLLSILLYFPFPFDCIGSVGDCACENFPLLCEVHFCTNPILRLRGLSVSGGRSQDLKNKGARLERPHQLWGEEVLSKGGHWGILLPQESKASPQASLVLTWRQTTSSSSQLFFPWCNNPNFEAPYWKTLTYTSPSF